MNDPLVTLEFNKILSQAAENAISTKGRQQILSLRPAGELSEVKNRLQFTEQAEKLSRPGRDV